MFVQQLPVIVLSSAGRGGVGIGISLQTSLQYSFAENQTVALSWWTWQTGAHWV